jgi:mannose-6-phosphate isomerase-like protein (cupin superfamily)
VSSPTDKARSICTQGKSPPMLDRAQPRAELPDCPGERSEFSALLPGTHRQVLSGTSRLDRDAARCRDVQRSAAGCRSALWSYPAHVGEVRRVVTGCDSRGRSRVVSDGPVPAIVLNSAPNEPLFDIWGVDGAAQVPTDGTRPTTHGWFPPTMGFRYIVATFAPDSSAAVEVDPAQLAREMDAKVPGAAAHYDPDHPGVHTTQSVDIGIVLEGQIWLELDEGEVALNPGDVIVQNGTRHAWRNHSSEPSRVAFALIGAQASSKNVIVERP